MKFTTILSLLAISTAAFAAKRPDGGPDGIYVEIEHDNGTTTVQYYGKANHTEAGAFGKRAGVGPQCTSGSMSRSDIVEAQGGLASFFGGGNAFYAKSVSNYHGGAVAFGCNYGKGQTMDANTFNGFMGSVDGSCGDTQAGYYNHPDWKASYGRTQSSSSFC